MFIPVLSHFLNKNPWTASEGRLRCRVLPLFPEEGEPALSAEVWEGPWAYEFSVVEEKRAFPMTREGLEELSAWLEQWRQSVETRPERSLAENVERRNAVAGALE